LTNVDERWSDIVAGRFPGWPRRKTLLRGDCPPSGHPHFFPRFSPAVPKEDVLVCAVAIDAEEDFDWLRPVEGTSYSTSCMRSLGDLHEILDTYSVVPTYLLTYPVMEDADAVRILRRLLETGRCVLGVQLHSWVTPPFGGAADIRTSFSGNLAADLEEGKLIALKNRFVARFGFEPRIFRAGRYGLGCQTAALLEKHGFNIDISLAPCTTFEAQGGPDFTDHDYALFWFGERRDLLEIPLCRSIVGWGGGLARTAYRVLSEPRFAALRLGSMLTRSRCAERITLSPEGNDARAMRRLVRRLRAQGQTIFTLSFHSSSLGIGLNPYVRSKADLHSFYDRLSATLAHLADELSFTFASIPQIPEFLVPRAPYAS
jgi:hypothetical protein